MLSTINADKARKYWGKHPSVKPEIDLIKLQIDSYNWFLSEGIKQVLAEISPVEDFTGKNWLLELGECTFGKSKYTPDEAKDKGVTYDAPLKVETTLTNKQTEQKFKQEVFLGDIPM